MTSASNQMGKYLKYRRRRKAKQVFQSNNFKEKSNYSTHTHTQLKEKRIFKQRVGNWVGSRESERETHTYTHTENKSWIKKRNPLIEVKWILRVPTYKQTVIHFKGHSNTHTHTYTHTQL